MTVSYILDEHSESRNQQLQQLIQQAKAESITNNKANLVPILEKIVKIVLYSRPICRLHTGKPLFGIYLEIYNQAKCELLEYVAEEIKQTTLFPSNNKWLYQKQDRIFKVILNDTNLKKLALAAKNQPPNSSLRSYGLRELVKAIELSQRILKMRSYGVSSQFEKLIYEEAVMETLSYVCTKIDLYDPDRGNQKFMNWVNFKLEKFLLKCRQEYKDPNIIKISSQSDLENMSYKKNTTDFSELLYQYIQQDVTNVFTSVFIKGCPQANFKEIALARLSGHTWKEISEYYGLTIPTLSSFFARNCEKFQHLFKKEFKS